MRNINIILISLLLLLSVLFIFIVNPLKKPTVVVNGKVFFVDVAKTDEQKAKGLSVYNKLPITRGMIFTFETSDYNPFWMKGMKFPIDIIYINNNKIVEIFESIPNPKNNTETPVTITPREKANYVLEINAGLSKKYKFRNGDTVKINL